MTVTAAPESGAEPFFATTVIVADRLLPVLVTVAEMETTGGDVGAVTLAEPLALPLSPLVPSLPDTLKADDPDAVAGEISDNVVETLAPGAREATEAGLNDEDQPLGIVAENVYGEAAQPEPFVLVAVIV